MKFIRIASQALYPLGFLERGLKFLIIIPI
jgi:hypothetical protein